MTRQTQHDREVQTLKDEASAAYDADTGADAARPDVEPPPTPLETALTPPSDPPVVAGPQFPKMIFRRDGGRQVVQSQAEQDALGASWQETPP